VTATVVLVHGAWHGAWCWERVLPLLANAGIAAVAVDLPGHGDSSEPHGDLHGDAASVAPVLDEVGPDVVLVGHSYGGAVITEAGVHPAVRHLVYLCAFALDEGESCQRAATAEATTLDHTGRPNLGRAMVDLGDGLVGLEPTFAAQCLYNDCDEATRAWAVARLGPQSAVALADTPQAVGWRAKPSTYVVCADDLIVHPGLQRVLAARCPSSVEWPTGHSPFLSQPELVAELLAGLALSRPVPGPP
jgi:pimeloyl-ACP methyl ester carboxylesterase